MLAAQGDMPAERPSPPRRQANGEPGGEGGRRFSYAEEHDDEASGSEADEDARRAAAAVRNAAIAALLEPDEFGEMDDEVERVISHRYLRLSSETSNAPFESCANSFTSQQLLV